MSGEVGRLRPCKLDSGRQNTNTVPGTMTGTSKNILSLFVNSVVVSPWLLGVEKTGQMTAVRTRGRPLLCPINHHKYVSIPLCSCVLSMIKFCMYFVHELVRSNFSCVCMLDVG